MIHQSSKKHSPGERRDLDRLDVDVARVSGGVEVEPEEEGDEMREGAVEVEEEEEG